MMVPSDLQSNSLQVAIQSHTNRADTANTSLRRHSFLTAPILREASLGSSWRFLRLMRDNGGSKFELGDRIAKRVAPTAHLRRQCLPLHDRYVRVGLALHSGDSSQSRQSALERMPGQASPGCEHEPLARRPIRQQRARLAQCHLDRGSQVTSTRTRGGVDQQRNSELRLICQRAQLNRKTHKTR